MFDATDMGNHADLHAITESSVAPVDNAPKDVKNISILAYVHLRNIHKSTGAGRTARQIVEHLALRSDVNLAILADAGDKQRIVPMVQGSWSGFRYRTFAAGTSAQQARWFFLDSPRAETYWPEAEIVYCTAESYVPVKKARLVVTSHDASYFEQGSHLRDAGYWKTRFKWELLYRKLARKADLFHTVSQFSADRLGHFFPEIKSRIRVVRNGVTPLFFGTVTHLGRAYLEASGLAQSSFVLVPGGLHFRKNAELILAAAPDLLARYPDLVIAIVNHTNPHYAARAKALGQGLRLLGFVSDEALHALYTAATVVWFPSRYEGFGLPVVEAMACGATVVASNSSSIPEIAGGAAVLIDPATPKAHVDAIGGLLSDPLARQQLAGLGRERASRFTWAACASELKRQFDSLL